MAGLIARDSMRHELKFRLLTVKNVVRVTEDLVRFTLTGPELYDFVSGSPADHLKVFFPDPATGELSWPKLPGTDGHTAGTGATFARDYTPLEFRPGAEPELDIETVLHGDGDGYGGVASGWAARAKIGDQLGVIGPRGSRLAPDGIKHFVIVADESALPVTRMWLREMRGVKVTALIFVAADPTTKYFDANDGGSDLIADPAHEILWFVGPGADSEALAALKEIEVDEESYFFLAGEAGALVPMRRYLRRELELPKEQVRVTGYWKRGVANRDHHEPIDPNDAD